MDDALLDSVSVVENESDAGRVLALSETDDVPDADGVAVSVDVGVAER